MATVNGPGWSPNNFSNAPRRYFQRPDGYIFPQPASEDYHIDRLLKEGWREVDSALTEAEKAALAAKEGKPLPAPAPDPKDAEIAALKAQLAEMEAKQHGAPTNDAAIDPRGARPDRRPR